MPNTKRFFFLLSWCLSVIVVESYAQDSQPVDKVFSLGITDNSGGTHSGAPVLHLDFDGTPDPTHIVPANVTTGPTIDGEGSDPAWANAAASNVAISPQAGGGNGITSATIKSVYDSLNIYFLVTWTDPTGTENIDKKQFSFDGTNWTQSGNEDRVYFMWNIADSTANFNTQGCALACHGTYMATPNPGEMTDVWHWKASRSNPYGFADDKHFVDSTHPDFDPSGDWGRVGDDPAGGNGNTYDNNGNVAAGPAFVWDGNGLFPDSSLVGFLRVPGAPDPSIFGGMSADAVPEGVAYSNDPAAGKATFDTICINCHGPGGTGGFAPDLVEVSRRRTKAFLIDKLTIGSMAANAPDGTEPDLVAYLQSLTTIPGYVLEDPSGSRADVHAFGVFSGGVWTVELKRKLYTGNPDDASFLSAPPSNQPPVASAGEDQQITLGQPFQLDGGGSSDPDNDPLSYNWSFVQVPQDSQAVLIGANTVSPTFRPDFIGDYVIQLIVNDGLIDSGPDTVRLDAQPAAPPIADAGPDQENVGFSTQVFLDASASQPSTGGDGLQFLWEQTSGAPVTITGADTATPNFITPTPNDIMREEDKERWRVAAVSPGDSTLTFKVTVEDVFRATAGDEVRVVITDAVASGLGNVGVGTKVFLNAPAQASYDWRLRRPRNCRAALAESTTRNPSFTPDRPGTYVARERNSRQTIRVNVGRWVGVGTLGGAPPDDSKGQCGSCHSGLFRPDFITPWAATHHAIDFSNKIDGLDSAGKPLGVYEESCLKCHSVGYDLSPTAVNDGFDDIARSLGWTFPQVLQTGNWLGVLANFGPLAQRANVQCENCHGPGSRHFGDKTKIRFSLDEGVCFQCHDSPPDYVKPLQWKTSCHARSLTAAGGIVAENEECAECHTAQGLVAREQEEDNEAGEHDHAHRMEPEPITCCACHDPHSPIANETEHILRFFGKTTLAGIEADADVAAVCTKCHTARGARPGTMPQFNQADMLFGVGGFEYPSETYDDAFHTSIKEKCIHCHMAATPAEGEPGRHKIGEHTWAVRYDNGTPNDTSDDILTDVCLQCHAAIPPDFDIDGVPSFIQGLLEQLAALLPKENGKVLIDSTNATTLTLEQKRAAFNWYFVENDRSRGIHNHLYAQKLLETSIDRVTTSPNVAPVADAGQDAAVSVNDSVALNAAGSSDGDGDPLTFLWGFTSVPPGSTAALNDKESAMPSFVPDLPGDYVVELVANDGVTDSAPDSVTITAEGPLITSLSPPNDFIIGAADIPTFRWASSAIVQRSGGLRSRRFVLQISSDPQFQSLKKTLKIRVRVPKTRSSEPDVRPLESATPNTQRWRKILKLAAGNANRLHWRVTARSGKELISSETRGFTIGEATGFPVVLSGQVFDGRDLNNNGLRATISVFESDGTTPVTVGADNSFATNPDGTYETIFGAPAQDPLLILKSSADAPFQDMMKAVQVISGQGTANFYMSNTLITGSVTGPDGSPAIVDLRVFRNDNGDGQTFNPYEIAGGRDSNPPAPPTGLNNGTDTDVLGMYNIPIRQADQLFRVKFVVDTSTDLFKSFTDEFFLPADQTTTRDIQLAPPSLEVSFADDVQPIFTARCTACHGAVIQFGGLRLDEGNAFANIVNAASTEVPPDVRVKPADSAASYLFEKISSDAPRVGSRMPAGGPFLSDNEIEIIQRWIDQGALDN